MWTLMVNHANFADTVITPSEHFRKKLLHYGVTKPITALHHGIDDELLKSTIEPKTYNPSIPLEIIWHSRVSGEKRILPFLEAINIIKNDYKYHLSIYGDGNDLKKAKKFVARHHLNVDFYGNTDLKTIKHALKNAHLDVLVSYNYDTFGMTLIEAAATGTPVLLADPDLTEILPSGSYVLSSDPSPKALANALAEIFKNQNLINQMSRAMISFRPSIKNSIKITKLLKIFKSNQEAAQNS
jgi:glycosyltransferase involved in cell wall biosynthesis